MRLTSSNFTSIAVFPNNINIASIKKPTQESLWKNENDIEPVFTTLHHDQEQALLFLYSLLFSKQIFIQFP